MTDADRAALKALVEQMRREADRFIAVAKYHPDPTASWLLHYADKLSALIAAGLSEAPAPQEKAK